MHADDANFRKGSSDRAQDEQGVIYDLPVVAVHEVPNFSWIKQVTVKLPDQLKGVGDVLVSLHHSIRV